MKFQNVGSRKFVNELKENFKQNECFKFRIIHFKNLSRNIKQKIFQKLNEVATLVAHFPEWNSATRQNPPICNPTLYIVETFEPVMPFKKIRLV